MNPITLIWIILGILVLVTVVAAVTAGVSRRKALREGSKPAQVSPAPTESGKTVPEAETPAGGESAVGRPESEASQVAEPAVEAPEAPGSRMARLRRRLANSNNALARGLAELLSADKLDDDAWDDFETTLITSDLGVGPTTELVEKLRSELAIDGISDPAHAREVLHHELVELVGSDMDRSINLDRLEGKPAVVLMVGVNGTGKTTTCGKLARVLVAEERRSSSVQQTPSAPPLASSWRRGENASVCVPSARTRAPILPPSLTRPFRLALMKVLMSCSLTLLGDFTPRPVSWMNWVRSSVSSRSLHR